LDRALCDGEAVGLTKLVCTSRGRILGAHILGPQTGDLIQEVVLAMRKGLPVGALSQTIHVYPTLAEGVRRAADQYYREKLFGGPLKGLLRLLMRIG
ncbi:MAG: pyridine nucleotide-disulfide oxidoreductase, partial [Candidatus Methylomirabilis sp.]